MVRKTAKSHTGENHKAVRITFPIASVGASAGGIEAIIPFIKAIPEKTGMAFVILQHLDPGSEDLLPEILSKITRIPIHLIKNDDKLVPGAIYVLPPGKAAEIKGSRFRLTARADSRESKMIIDRFMCSLAEAAGERSAGIILSGANNDGTLGLQAIREAGGITFAQLLRTSKYIEMPRSAAAFADFILPPKTIASKLCAIFSCDVADIIITHENLQAIYRLIGESKHVDFSEYKQTTMIRRISRRMLFRKSASAGEYIELLKNDAEELEELCSDLLINVTSFFRDQQMFDHLQKKIFPRLLKNRTPDMPLRIWVAGCSTGEEVYSLAILIAELAGMENLKNKVQIFASDLKESVLRKARAGSFKHSINAAVSEERLKRFFVRKHDGYQVNGILRECCTFVKHNVLQDPPFSRIDVLSCRNMLIYMTADLQRQVLSAFHFALRPGGYLVLGSSETITGLSTDFIIVDKKNNIYENEKTGSAHLPEFIYKRKPLGRALQDMNMVLSENVLRQESGVKKKVDDIILERYTPSGIVVNENLEIVHFRGKTEGYLEFPTGKATFNLMKMLRHELLPHVHAAMHRVKKAKGPVTSERILLRREHQPQEVVIEVVPLVNASNRHDHFLILFNELPVLAPNERTAESPSKIKVLNRASVSRLEKELILNKEYLRVLIHEKENATDELKSAYEEIQSSNEELRSANEELETSKEELQSANEELTTVNEELHTRNQEMGLVNDDLRNYLDSVDAPILVLNKTLEIRHFTPAAERVFSLKAHDIGRSISDIKLRVKVDDICGDIRSVVRTRRPKEQEVQDSSGINYILRIRPYLAKNGKIEGALVVFINIEATKRAYRQIEEMARFPLENPNPVLRVSNTGALMYANPGAASLLRYWKIKTGDIVPDEIKKIVTSCMLLGNNREYDISVENKIFSLFISPVCNSQYVIIYGRDVTKHKQAEDALRESEERYRGLFEHMTEGFAYCQMIFEDGKAQDWVYLSVNKAFEGLTGLKDAAGKRVSQLIPGIRQSDPGLFDMYARVSLSGKPEKFETFVQALNIWFSIAVYSPQKGYFVAMFDVITERKLTEQALKDSEERFHTMANAMPQLAWIAKADGYIYWYNQRWYDYTGTTPAQMEGWGWQSVHDPELLPSVMERWKASIATGEPFEMEFPLRGADGTFRSFLTRGIPLKDNNRHVVQWFGTNTDVHELKQVQDSQRESEKKLSASNRVLRTLTDSGQAMIRAVDEVTYIKQVCEIIVKDGGYRMAWVGFAEDDEDKTIWPVAKAGFEDGYLETINISWADTDRGRGPTGTAVRTGQVSICRNMLEDPKIKPWREQAIKRGYASSIAFPLKYYDKTYGALTLYSENPDPFTDDEINLLTELADDLAYGISVIRLRSAQAKAEEILKRDKQMLEKLVNEQANQMVKAQLEVEKSKRLSDIGQLASTIAHELRNPLVAIKMAAYNIQRKAANPNLEKHIVNINKKVAESDLIIQNLLNFGKTKVPHFETIDLCELIKENMNTVSTKYLDWNVDLKDNFNTKGICSVDADAGQLAALFSNILDNAYQSLSGKEGKIEISVNAEDGGYEITIKDNGSGIAEGDLQRIFDPFYTTKARGTGLGLTVCREIVTLHGGTLDITSVKNIGTAVNIHLPARH